MAAAVSTTQSPVRFAIVGCGGVANAHIDAIAESADAELTAIVEIRRELGEQRARALGCRAFTDYRDPDLRELVDVAIVCTPPATHFEIARHFLELDLAVLCEKPLTIEAAEAQELVKVARSHDALLMMASKFRYVADVLEAKSIVDSGKLGRLVLYENAFCSSVDMSGRWNSDRELAGGGVLIDNGTHSVDIARYLLGPVDKIRAQPGNSVQGLEVEDTMQLRFLTTGGVICTVDLSWSLNKESEHYISIYGSDGTVQIGWQGSRYRLRGDGEWTTFGSGYNKAAAFGRQLENVVGSLRGEEEPLIRPYDAWASVQVIEAAYRSVGADLWAEVESQATV